MLLITHDLDLGRNFGDRVAVMERRKAGRDGGTEALFANPRHPHTTSSSQPTRARVEPVEDDAPTLLRTEKLRVEYPKPIPGWRGWFRRDSFAAVVGADVTLRAGETIGVVGESGSGKSTLAQAILGLVKTHGGALEVEGSAGALGKRAQRARRAWLQVVFQDPFASLSPRRTVRRSWARGWRCTSPS